MKNSFSCCVLSHISALCHTMPKQKLPTRLVNRFMTSFTTQIARRGFRAIGVPNSVVPILTGIVRRVNYQIQWGNRAVWEKRMQSAKDLYQEFIKEKQDVSPVYRFRGPSNTVREASGEFHRPVSEIPKPKSEPTTRYEKLRAKIDSTTIILGGLTFVVFASMGGPILAKKLKWVDPLDAASSRLDNFSLK